MLGWLSIYVPSPGPLATIQKPDVHPNWILLLGLIFAVPRELTISLKDI